MKLDFIVPGFSKCGTTSLCKMLGAHPDIFIPEMKEPSYFAENYRLGWNWYLQSFTDRKQEKLSGEGSTVYSSLEYAKLVCQRIEPQFPKCKFIFIVRNPIERLESSFREMHASGYRYAVVPDYHFGRALRQLPNMVADTMYSQIMRIFLDHFPKEQIHVLFLEDMKLDAERELEKCFEFLDVDASSFEQAIVTRANASKTKVCDTKLLRWIRTGKVVAQYWNHIRVEKQEVIMKRFKLRRRFDDPIEWDDYAKCVFNHAIRSDAIEFLRMFGKPDNYWDFSKTDPLALMTKAA